MTGPELKAKRIEARITLRRFWQGSGIDLQKISDVESGKRHPSKTFEKIYLFWVERLREEMEA